MNTLLKWRGSKICNLLSSLEQLVLACWHILKKNYQYSAILAGGLYANTSSRAVSLTQPQLLMTQRDFKRVVKLSWDFTDTEKERATGSSQRTCNTWLNYTTGVVASCYLTNLPRCLAALAASLEKRGMEGYYWAREWEKKRALFKRLATLSSGNWVERSCVRCCHRDREPVTYRQVHSFVFLRARIGRCCREAVTGAAMRKRHGRVAFVIAIVFAVGQQPLWHHPPAHQGPPLRCKVYTATGYTP